MQHIDINHDLHQNFGNWSSKSMNIYIYISDIMNKWYVIDTLCLNITCPAQHVLPQRSMFRGCVSEVCFASLTYLQQGYQTQDPPRRSPPPAVTCCTLGNRLWLQTISWGQANTGKVQVALAICLEIIETNFTNLNRSDPCFVSPSSCQAQINMFPQPEIEDLSAIQDLGDLSVIL